MLAVLPDEEQRMALAPPAGQLDLVEIVAAAPGSTDMILRGLSLSLPAGESLGIIGPSGSGKSTLAKVIFGIWPALRGCARLDGADVTQLDHEHAGSHLGYLPQSVELLPGTIAENIRRLGPDDPAGVIEAAELAGAHELILGLPQGYDTMIGNRGFALSGGQMQRIGLARALYGNPRLVLLDEPDGDLDEAGERALVAAIATLRGRGTTLIVISHKTALIQPLDKLLVMNAGQVVKFGTMDEFANASRSPNVRVVR
jgi:ATP-binding cassette subfamily C protein EexD